MSKWYEGLRDPQRDVAGVDRGDYILIAGPGTGKTFVLVRRLEYLVEELGISARDIVALTFTRAAAGEMRLRLEERLDSASRPRVSTLHSYALRELIVHGSGAIQKPVRVVDDWEQRRVVEEELARLLGRNVRPIQRTLKLLADDWDNLAADGEGWEAGFADPQFLTAWKRHRAIYSYTLRAELVYQLLQMYRTNPTLTPSHVEVFLVDEYQDLNQCDLNAIRILVERSGAEIFAAGDDDQSIYSFRHAHPKGIRDFESDYHGSTVLRLEECLRCGEDVVAISDWLIKQELERIPKTLRSVTDWEADVTLIVASDEAEEVAALVSLVSAAVNGSPPTKPSAILILLRSDRGGSVSRKIANGLSGAGIATYVPREALGRSQDLQILTEYMNLAQLPRDDLALRSLLELEDNGIGKKRIRALVQVAWDREIGFGNALRYLKTNPGEYGSTGLDAVLAAAENIQTQAAEFGQSLNEDLPSWVERIVGVLELRGDALAVVTEAASYVGDSLDELGPAAWSEISIVQEIKAALAEIQDSRPPRVDDKVTITTMHGSKGLSADMVFVLHAEDEVIPDGLKGIEHDESRRLLYVSLSRAKKHLYINTCTFRDRVEIINDKRVPPSRTLSRFLTDYGLVGVAADSLFE